MKNHNNRNSKHKTQKRVTGTQDKSYFYSLKEMVGEGEIRETEFLWPEKCVRGNTYSVCSYEASRTGLEER